MAISDFDYIKDVQITREELYEMAWTERLSEISKKYYISENTLIKKCQELHIPLPNLKYWIKSKDHQNPPDKIPLPKYSGRGIIYLKLRADVEHKRESIASWLSQRKKEIVNDTAVKLKVLERLTNPDPLIAEAKDRLYKKEVYKKDQGIIYRNQGSIGIYVSANQIARALRFMDTIIKALRARGHQFINKNGKTHVVVYGEEYAITCKEKERRIIVKDKYWDRSELEPTGKLVFRIGESYWLKEWTENKTPIEEQVAKILTGIEYRGWKDQQDRIEREKQHAIQEEKERIEAELRAKKEKELADFKELFKKAKRHEKAEVIRRYVYKLEESALSRNALTDDVKKTIEWARNKADWYDPFTETFDELLDDVNRENLDFKKRGYWL